MGHIELFDAGEAGGGEHMAVLGEGEGVAGGGIDEHHHGERGGCGRGDAVFIGDHFENEHPAAMGEGVVEAAHERFAGGPVEVVVEIGDENDVIALAQVDGKGAAGEELILGFKTGGSYLCAGDVEDGGKILGDDCGGGMAAGKGHAEEAVAGGYVEHLSGDAWLASDFGHELGGGGHHGMHGLGKGDPLGDLFAGEGFFEGGVAAPNGLGEQVGSAEDFGGEEKGHGGCHAGRGIRGEEDGAGGGVGVFSVGLGDEAEDGEGVAEDADAAFGDATVMGDGGGCFVALGESAEDVEFDSGAEGGGALMGGKGVPDEGGVRF